MVTVKFKFLRMLPLSYLMVDSFRVLALPSKPSPLSSGKQLVVMIFTHLFQGL